MEQQVCRFTGFASVPLNHPGQAITEAAYALDELGLPGIALPCLVAGRPLDHPDHAAFWEFLGGRGRRTVVYLHPVGSDSAPAAGLADWGLSMLLGSTMRSPWRRCG